MDATSPVAPASSPLPGAAGHRFEDLPVPTGHVATAQPTWDEQPVVVMGLGDETLLRAAIQRVLTRRERTEVLDFGGPTLTISPGSVEFIPTTAASVASNHAPPAPARGPNRAQRRARRGRR